MVIALLRSPGINGRVVASGGKIGAKPLERQTLPMETLLSPPAHPPEDRHLRTFDPARDLDAVADLVELCFSSTLDADGRRYLRQMRAAARNPNLVRLARRLGEGSSFPMTGFVWDAGGRVVGNLSLIPFQWHNRKVYMIANVAVHPDFRRRGIARALTHAALDQLQRSGADYPWLQVREDNPEAIQLYLSLGFHEQFRRSTWQTEPGPIPAAAPDPDVRITPLKSSHARRQQQWLLQAYPPVLEWHLPFRVRDLHPGLLGFVRRMFNGVFVRQWSVLKQNRLAGVAAWQSTQGYYNALWLGLPEPSDENAAAALLLYARRAFGMRQPLMVEYPAQQAVAALSASGFQLHQTLIWMRTDRWK